MIDCESGGYTDVNDVERRSQDPTVQLIGSVKIRELGAAFEPQIAGCVYRAAVVSTVTLEAPT